MEPQTSNNKASTDDETHNKNKIRIFNKILTKINCPSFYYPALNDIKMFKRESHQFNNIALYYPPILSYSIKKIILPDQIDNNTFIAITKYFFIIISEFKYVTHCLQLIFTTLKRLYCQKFYTLNELILFIQFDIVINTDKNKINDHSHLRTSLAFLNEIIELTSDISIKDNAINTIVTLLSEISNISLKIKMDFINENIYDLISFDSCYDSLSPQTQCKLNEWLISLVIYQYNTPFHCQVVNSIVNQFKRDEFSDLPNRYLGIITKAMINESKVLLNDPYAFNHGFYFADTINPKQGSVIESDTGFIKNESYCFIFSFKLSLSFKGNCSLVSLYDYNTKSLSLSIDITDMKLFIAVNNNDVEWNTNILFEKEKSYYIIIIQSKPLTANERVQKMNIYINGQEKKSEVIQFPNGEKHKLYIGHNPISSECTFRGYFSTLMLFCKIHNIPLQEEFIKYKGYNYEQKFFNELTINEKGSINNDSMKKYEHLKLIITCSWKLRNQTNIKKFNHNVYDISVNAADDYLIELTNVFPYKQYSTINEFILVDGIKYLQLLCEYYLLIMNEQHIIKDDKVILKM